MVSQRGTRPITSRLPSLSDVISVMLTAMNEYLHHTEIDTNNETRAVTFTANGEYLLSGGFESVQVCRVKDGKCVAMMQVKNNVYCVAVSRDGRYLAAGSHDGDVLVWDARTYELAMAGKIPGGPIIPDIDFSPDATRLVSADSGNNTATVWNIAAPPKVQQILVHDSDGPWVQAARYSPQGERVATATKESVRVWDSDDGHLLLDIKVGLSPWRGLLWSSNRLFVIADNRKIKEIDATTGSIISEWLVPGTDDWSCIALPLHGKFIAYSTTRNVTFWDTSTHVQLGLIPWSSEIHSIASSSANHLAIVEQGRKIIVRDLSLIKEPDIVTENAAFGAWKDAQLTGAEALLTATIPTSKDTAYRVLASRALVRTRLQQWDAAVADANESIKIHSSVIGYAAKYVALVGKGETHRACRVCDIAFHLHPNYVPFLLLIKAITLFIAGEHEDAISRMDDLIAAGPLEPTFCVVQAYMHFLLGNFRMESGDYKRAIQSFQDARVTLGNCTCPPLLIVSLISGWKFNDLATTIRQRLCEAFFVAGRTKEAAASVLQMVYQEINMAEPINVWVSKFMERCLSTPENSDNTHWVTTGNNTASHPLMALLKEWARLRLATRPWKDILTVATSFVLPRSTIFQVICEHLEMIDRVADAVACFHQMYSEQVHGVDGKQANWIRDFKSRCCGKLGGLGDVAMNARQYDDAILHYTAALSLNFITPQVLLGKRSKAHACKGEWKDALNDANRVIGSNPSSPLGYKRKYAALYGMGHYDDATHAFEIMLLKMSESSSSDIREQSRLYVRPEQTKETIRTTIEDAIRDSPSVLINTTTGRLCNKSDQASAFKNTPAFTGLISSMTTYIDKARIEQEVWEFYRYATFSHKWEEDEPLFEKVTRIVVYDLEASPAHEKLQMFCKIVREAGFNWAWSDTCCINKGDHFMLQEALVSMFKWYEHSAMTLIFLRGVGRLAKRGALTRSIWNMRAWTLQEYHASKAVQIYTEDWTPYLGLTIYNHKEAPEVISEMEEATGVRAQALMALRPGLDEIREKLRLASTRQTTRVEDAAYSMLGIFSTSLPITYGEGDNALGRLLSQLLMSSGDMSILAWTGRSGSFNSCLPSSITVFSQPPTSHIPLAVPSAEIRSITTGLRLVNLTMVTKLYDGLNGLSGPIFVGRRMKLPCLAFKLGEVASDTRSGSERTFRAQTTALGTVEFRTEEDLSQLGSLCLVHPWIDFLLDRQPVGNVTETITEENADDKLGESPSFSPLNTAPTTRQTRTARLMSRIGWPLSGHSAPDTVSLRPPSTVSPVEKQTRALQFLARLRQPFGALLLTRTRQNMEEYRRVSAESLITVQVEDITPAILDKLIQGVRMLDVL